MRVYYRIAGNIDLVEENFHHFHYLLSLVNFLSCKL